MADTKCKYSPDQYHNKFDPKVFYDTYYATYYGGTSNDEGFQNFYLGGQSDFWSNYERRSSRDEVRCLDYGGGATISTLIGAAPKVDRIVFAEFTKVNRQAVLSWVAGKPEAIDWKPLIKYVCDREGDGSTKAVLKREEELKKKLKSVVSCDIYKSPIVDFEDVDKGQLFDVVTTSFCLEVCVTSAEQYKSTVVKLSQLVKPSGYLRMDGLLEQTFYMVGQEKFYSFPLTKTMVEDAMKDAQMKDIKMEMMELKETGVVSDGKFIFRVVGQKQGRQ